MCGISGIVYRDPLRPVAADALSASMTMIEHRGPDDHGTYRAPGVGLASRRLAVLDLSPRGHMPMQTADGRYVITYNGEVYNYRDLRGDLCSAGVRFSSDTDTEVVLRLFEREGPSMLSKLNGMFAFAVWDSLERSLFLGRDRLGVKPLYYCESDDALMFASEEKALFPLGHPAHFDAAVVPELLSFKFVAGESTPFAGVKRLLPGHYLLWRDGRLQMRRWWHLADRATALGQAHMSDAAGWFEETFDDSVSLRRISDVPLGVLLSSGLDSSSVAASLARQERTGLASFTVRFAEAAYDEGPAASAFAAELGLAQHELEIPTSRLVDLLDRASWLNDGPLAHSSDLHLLAIAEYAKPTVTVLLSGEGADETLGGYDRYQPLRYGAALSLAKGPAQALLKTQARGRLRKLARLITTPDPDAAVLFNACDVLPQDLALVGLAPDVDVSYRSRMIAEAKQLYPTDLFRQALYLDLHTYLSSLLHRNDRMTMGASIECRVPFLDYRLVEGLAALPSSKLLCGRRGKPLLRRAIGDRLPAHLRARRKWGFGVPWSRYLRDHADLKERVEALRADETLLAAGCDSRSIASLTARFFAGDPTTDPLVQQLVMLVTWRQAYFKRLANLNLLEPGRAISVSPPKAASIPVLLVGNFLSGPNGGRGVCEDLALRLPEAGCPVVTTSSKPARLPRLLDMVGTAWTHRHGYAVAQVDVYSGPAFFWAEAVCAVLKLARKPYILTLHGGNLPQFAARWPGRVRTLLQSAAVVTTPSRYLLEHLSKYRDDVRFLPNGLDTHVYRPRSEPAVGPKLVWLRAFHRIYNPSLAVRMLPLLVPRFPGVRLTMVGAEKGDGSLHAARRLAAQLGVADRIEFHAAVPKSEVPRVLGAADIFLNTTNIESAGVTVVEAMACGLCVVTTNVGGMPYLVDHEKDGLLVPPDDPRAMADAVLRILDDPALAARLSRNARQKAQQFDWPPIIGQWRSLFAATADDAA